MQLHKAKSLFAGHKWLRITISDTTPFRRTGCRTLDEWIENVLHHICFYNFEKVNLEAHSSLYDHWLDVGTEEGSEYVRITAEYYVVYDIGVGTRIGDWHIQTVNTEQTIREAIAEVEELRLTAKPRNRPVRYVAIVRKKTTVSNFGERAAYDIFPFLDGWKPVI